MKCLNCGNEISDDLDNCSVCGAQILRFPDTQNESTEIQQNSELIPNVENNISNNFEGAVVSENVEQQVSQEVTPNTENSNVLPQENVPIQNEVVNPVQPQVAPIPQNVEQNANIPSNNKKSNSKLIIIIIVILLIVGIVLAVVLLLGDNGNNNNSENKDNIENTENGNNEINNNENTEDNGNRSSTNIVGNGKDNNVKNFDEATSKEITNQVTDEVVCGLENYITDCLLIVKNNSQYNANIVLDKITFYDENDNIIGGVNGPLYANGVKAGATGYMTLWHIFRDNNTNFSRYEVSYYLQSFRFNTHNDEVTYTVERDDENREFKFKVKSNSDEIIDGMNLGMFFYRGDKLVGVEIHGYNKDLNGTYIEYIKPYEEFYETITYPLTDSREQEIDYDRYEVKVLEAYTFLDGSSLRYRNSHLRED